MHQATPSIRSSFFGRRNVLIAGALISSLVMLGSAATMGPAITKHPVPSVVPMVIADGEGTSMYRYPDISDDEIVFVYANDLWRVPIEGGTALPLASPEGTEGMPRFSPSGDEVAFMAVEPTVRL